MLRPRSQGLHDVGKAFVAVLAGVGGYPQDGAAAAGQTGDERGASPALLRKCAGRPGNFETREVDGSFPNDAQRGPVHIFHADTDTRSLVARKPKDSAAGDAPSRMAMAPCSMRSVRCAGASEPGRRIRMPAEASGSGWKPMEERICGQEAGSGARTAKPVVRAVASEGGWRWPRRRLGQTGMQEENLDTETPSRGGKSALAGMPVPLGACLAETKGRRSAKYAALRYRRQQSCDRTLNV